MGIIFDKTAVIQVSTKTRKRKIHCEQYDSVIKMTNDLKNRPVTDDRFKSSIDHSRIEEDSDWFYVKNYDEALTLLRDGYAPQVTTGEIEAIAESDGKRMSIQNDIVGFAPIVPLALKGIPTCMLNTHIRPIKSKVLDLYFDATYTAGISASRMVENGKKILGAIMALEKSGYRVNLYAMQGYWSHGDEGADILTVKIKSSNQPFDLKRMSYALMHPAFFRVIGFEWYAKCPGATYRGGLGTSMTRVMNYDDAKKVIKQVFGNNAVYLSGTETMYKDQKEVKNEMTTIA